MGFFSSIGNFVSQNVQSAIHDVVHLENQITSNPIVMQILPIAGMAIGIPPQVTSMGLTVLNGLQGQILGNNNSSEPTPTDSITNVNISPNEFTPTAQTPDGQPLYLSSSDGKYHYVSDHTKIFEISSGSASTTSTAKTTIQKITDNVQNYWYIYLGCVAVVVGLIFYFKKKKTSKKW